MNLIEDSIDWNLYIKDTEDGKADIQPASTYTNGVVNLLHGREEKKLGQRTPWAKVEDRLAFRPGEVTIWAGINGHGKSGTLGFITLNGLVNHSKWCIASMEMKPEATMARMCRQACGSALPTVELIERFQGWTDDRLWLYTHRGEMNPNRMLALSRYCRIELGIEHVVIDSLMKCGIRSDDYPGQANFVDKLCVLARDTGLHIHLVHHIRKSEHETKTPDKFDVRGAGEISDLVDNVIIVFRNKRKEVALEDETDPTKIHEWSAKPDCFLMCDKQRHFTWEGRIGLWFDKASLQLLESCNESRRYIDFCDDTWKREWKSR